MIEDYIEFTDSWDLFWEQLQMRFGDLYVIKVIVKEEYIELTFEKVSEDVEEPDEDIEQWDDQMMYEFDDYSDSSDPSKEISDPSEGIEKWVDEMMSGFDDVKEEKDVKEETD